MSGWSSSFTKQVGPQSEKAGQSIGSRMSSGIGKTLKRGALVAGAGAVGAIGVSLAKGFSRLQGIDQAESKLRGLGHSAKGVERIMDNALASVRGTAFGLDAAATTAAGAVAAGIKPGKQLERTLKVVADSATIAGVGMGEMGAIFNKVASSDMIQGDVLAQLGDKGIPILQLLSKELGVAAKDVRKMASDGEIDFAAFQRAMEKGLGGAAQESGKTFAGAVANTQAAMGRLGAVVLGPIFERIPGILEGLMVKIDAMAPVAERVAAVIGDGFLVAGQVIRDYVVPVFATLAGVLVNQVWPAAQAFGGWLAENTGVLKVLAGIIGAATAAFVVYSATVKVVTAVTAAWNAIQKVLNGTLKANPIGIVVTALAALAAGLVIAYKKSDTFRAVVDKAWSVIKATISAAWERVIKPALSAFSGFLTDTLAPAVSWFWTKVIKPVFDAIGKAISLWWNIVVKPVFMAVRLFLESVLFPVFKAYLNNVVRPIFNTVGKVIKGAWEKVIRPVFRALGDFINDKVVPAFKTGVDAIGRAWGAISDLARKPVNFVIDTVYNNGIRKAFNWIAEKLGSKLKLPHVQPVGMDAAAATRRMPAAPGGMVLGGGAGRAGTGAFDPSHGAFGGPIDWVKNVLTKPAAWAGGKMKGMVDDLLGGIGSSEWAQTMGNAARQVGTMATDWIKGKLDDFLSLGAGPAGKAGRVLPAGAYRIGMPYLGYPGHYGADYPAPVGTPVYALSQGTVGRAMSMAGSYGKHIYLDHPGGIQTRYAHLSEYFVRAGQQVAPGQMIGRVGSTGNSTGPHLHFEYRRNGQAINPAGLGIFDNGGWLKPGMGGINLSSKPEPVFTHSQWEVLKGAMGGPGRRTTAELERQLEILGMREQLRDARRALNAKGEERLQGIRLKAARIELELAQRQMRQALREPVREVRQEIRGTQQGIRQALRAFNPTADMGVADVRAQLQEFRRSVREAGVTWTNQMKRQATRLIDTARQLDRLRAAHEKLTERLAEQEATLAEVNAQMEEMARTVSAPFLNDIFGLGYTREAGENPMLATLNRELEVLRQQQSVEGLREQLAAATGAGGGDLASLRAQLAEEEARLAAAYALNDPLQASHLASKILPGLERLREEVKAAEQASEAERLTGAALEILKRELQVAELQLEALRNPPQDVMVSHFEAALEQLRTDATQAAAMNEAMAALAARGLDPAVWQALVERGDVAFAQQLVAATDAQFAEFQALWLAREETVADYAAGVVERIYGEQHKQAVDAIAATKSAISANERTQARLSNVMDRLPDRMESAVELGTRRALIVMENRLGAIESAVRNQANQAAQKRRQEASK